MEVETYSQLGECSLDTLEVYSRSFGMAERIKVIGLMSCHRRKVVLLIIHVLDLLIIRERVCVKLKHRCNVCWCFIPLSEMPISKATPAELLDSIASTPPLANLPTQLPRPDVNGISEKLSSESFNVALSLMFDTKNCGVEEESEHKAMVIDSCSLCGRVKDDGEDGRLWVLKEVILLMINCCVVCA